MPKLSVVIPVYNVEAYVAKCLDSVIYPALGDYEIVIVNDGSTDSSGDICAQYAARYPAIIRLITTENGGLGKARDVGIDAATGEYIVFIDSDDWLSENALPEMMAALETGFDICFFDAVSVNEAGKTLKYMRGCSREGEFTLEEYPGLLFENPSAWNKIYRRALFTDSGIYYPGRVWYEDVYVTPLLYPRAGKMRAINRPWYNYLQRAGSITKDTNTSRQLEIIPAIDAMLEGYRKAGLFEKYHDELEYFAFFHQVITSSTRICLANPKSPELYTLYEDFISKFPEYRRNPYMKTLSKKYKLLHFFVRHRMYNVYYLIMRANNILKGK